MEELILIKIANEPNFENLPHNFIVKDIRSGKLYIGNSTLTIDEIKTDKSNNWAKVFFYGNS
jgi:hypothetical protein